MRYPLSLVAAFHKQFHVPILEMPSLIANERSDLRYRLMREEVDEYLHGVKNRDLENIAHELADVLYTVYGTILEHGLQDVIQEIFEEVHRSNMSKDYSPGKMIKGSRYTKVNIGKILNRKPSEKIYNKLIRDNTPEIIENDGGSCVTRQLSDDEYKHALLEKLVEEAQEVRDTRGKRKNFRGGFTKKLLLESTS